LRLFSFVGYGFALAALAHVVFGAYDSYPNSLTLDDNSQLLKLRMLNRSRADRNIRGECVAENLPADSS